MSVEKAKKFISTLKADTELQKKMSGFNLDELKEAATAMKDSGEITDSDLENVAGGVKSTIVYSCGFVVD